MPTQTTLFPTISQSASTLPKQQMRQADATSAQSFAQIMQSFGGESKIAESAKETQDASEGKVHQEQTAQTDGANDADEVNDGDDAQAKSDQKTQGSASDATKNDQTQPDPKTQDAKPDIQGHNTDTDTDSSQPTKQDANQSAPASDHQPKDDQPVKPIKDQTALRQLEFQGDRARFTIKGIERQLTHAADVNLAAQAKASSTLSFQVSNAQAGNQSPTDAGPSHPNTLNQQSSEPDSKAKASLIQDQLQSDAARIGQRLAQPTTEHAQPRASDTPNTQVQPDFKLPPQPLPSEQPLRHEAQSTRSQRNDAAQLAGLGAQPTQSNRGESESIQSTQRNAIAGISNLTTRAIVGVGSGQGTSQQGIDSGSLAQKMQSTELPSEAKRAGVLAQVQRGLASMLRSGKSEMTLKLTPGHLGEIKIHIKSDGDQLAIRIDTTTKEAADYLKSSAEELGSNLKSKGVEVLQLKIVSAEQEPGDTDVDGKSTSDPGDESSDQEPRNEQHPDHQPAQTRASELDPDEPGQSQGVWTELGLDAIA